MGGERNLPWGRRTALRIGQYPPMAAFRFLALITVGFILLMFVFLLNAGHSRLEREATRRLLGPELALEEGKSVVWTVDFGASRIEQAWPGVQRQPHLYIEGLQGASVVARAQYVNDEGESVLDAFVDGGLVRAMPWKPEGGAEEGPEEENGPPSPNAEFGPLWMSWEYPLQITITVIDRGDSIGTAQPILRGQPSKDFIASRAISRTLWMVFSIIGAMGFAGLLATQKELFGATRGAPSRAPQVGESDPSAAA